MLTLKSGDKNLKNIGFIEANKKVRKYGKHSAI